MDRGEVRAKRSSMVLKRSKSSVLSRVDSVEIFRKGVLGH